MFVDRPLSVYFDFPPDPGIVDHAGFSWPVFIGLALLIAAGLAPFLMRAVKFLRSNNLPGETSTGSFPAWGWAGVFLCAAAWVLAWTRFDWFADFQAYPFPFLWAGYILAINALCRKRTGTCLMTERPAFFALLFPASAVFWWFFEYLNRFVGNWYYVGVEMFAPWQYIGYATICFATVLPAVLSTSE
ncbi:MAG: hypothetical protein ACOC7W_07545, partial [Desulfosalsimonas sp.]